MDEIAAPGIDDLGLTIWDLLKTVGEAAALVGPDYRLVWANDPLWAQIKPGVKVVGEPCFSVFADRSQPCATDCPVTPVWETGQPQTVERAYLAPDGKQRWREARAFPIRNRRGEIALVLRISYDITRRKLEPTLQDEPGRDLARALTELNAHQVERTRTQPELFSPLTRREIEILRLVAKGFSNPQISSRLTISINTVKRHIDNIFNKLGVNDRTRAAVWATRHGLL